MVSLTRIASGTAGNHLKKKLIGEVTVADTIIIEVATPH